MSIDMIEVERRNRSNRLNAILRETGALLEGHFVLKSGLHSGAYVNKDAVYPYVRHMGMIAQMVHAELIDRGWPAPEVVAGPEKGGIILAQWVAMALCYDAGNWEDFQPKAIYCEKQPDGSMAFQRGYDKLIKGRRVLVVEDIVTTGGSLSRALQAVLACGGELIGAIAMVDRSEDGEGPSEKFAALTRLEIATFSPDNCFLCRDKVPINVDVGHGSGRK